MKQKIKVYQNISGKSCGKCNVCENYFHKGDKYVVLYSYNIKSKLIKLKFCIPCYIHQVGKEVGYKEINEIIDERRRKAMERLGIPIPD